MSNDDNNQSHRRDSIFEVLDELIFHLNTTRGLFSFLIVSAFILGPLSLIVAAIFALHPRLLFFMLQRSPEVGGIIVLFLTLTVVLAAIWLGIGIRERAFFAAWNKRFGRFMSLRQRIDKELSDGTLPPENDDNRDSYSKNGKDRPVK
jgi:hypothetical protein